MSEYIYGVQGLGKLSGEWVMVGNRTSLGYWDYPTRESAVRAYRQFKRDTWCFSEFRVVRRPVGEIEVVDV